MNDYASFLAETKVPLSEAWRAHKLRRASWGGGKARLPTEPMWRRINMWLAEGWTMGRIADAAGLDVQLLHQRLPTMHRAKVARVMALTRADLYATAGDHDLVPAVGARRRVQALHALGWGVNDITQPAGSTASRVNQPDRKVIAASTWRTIEASYVRLSMTRGNGRQAANRARRNAWLPPLCWDDDTIDDPSAQPHSPRTRQDDRSGPHAEMLERVAELTARGLSAAEVAERIGVTQRTVVRGRAAIRDEVSHCELKCG